MGALTRRTSPTRRRGSKLSSSGLGGTFENRSGRGTMAPSPMKRSQSDPRGGSLPRSGASSDAGASGPAFPSIHGRQLSRNATAGGGGGASTMSPRLDVPNHRGAKETENRSGYLWRAPGAARARPSVLEGWMKKRGGTINHWADRYYVLRGNTLEQYAKGEEAGSADPKHEYELGAGCSVSVIKEVKTGGKIIYAFQLEWPQLHQEKEGAETETEGAGCGRPVHDEESGDSEGAQLAHGSPAGEVPTPLDSPIDVKSRRADGDDGGLPFEPPLMHRVSSNGSLLVTIPAGSQQELRQRRPRCNTGSGGGHGSGIAPPMGPSTAASPALSCKKLSGAKGGDEECRNETIEHMVAAQRENETRMARLKQEELEQLTTEYEQKVRRQEKQKKKDKKQATTRGQAVAVTAVGVSWLTAGIATGGLVLAGGLVAAGLTLGSMGAYHQYKSLRNSSGCPGRVRLAHDKLEVAEQWRETIRQILEKLQTVPKAREMPAGSPMWITKGLGLGIPGWSSARPETPPPALKAIDLRVVDEMLGNAEWMSRDVIQGIPIFDQDLSVASVSAEGGGGAQEGANGGPCKGWGLGGEGPVLKSQTIVRASALETFVAVMGVPRNSMNAVVSGTIGVQCMDDHSDVVRLCTRAAWLGVAWAAPRDFCLARYWHRAEDGCYIVCLSSMKHPKCPVDPEFVRGELHAVYTVSPRRDYAPDADVFPECLLACHAQVEPKGWVWNGLGFRERYTSHILMHVLEVRNVIEAERFLVPRVNLRPDSPSSGSSSPHSTSDGNPFLFEVLGVSGFQQERRGSTSSGQWRREGDGDEETSALRGSTSLENVPPPALDPRMWAEADGTEFSVRGGSYLSSRVKVQSAKQVFGLRAVDMFVVPEPTTHLASHPDNRVQIARKAGETPFVWVLQIMVPGPPHYAFVCYFTPQDENWLDQSTPFGKLAERVFFSDDDDFRDQRLKLIPKIIEGNWVVKRAAGNTPAILGTKLKQHHFKGNNYLETDLEIGSSSVAASVTRLCTGYAKSLVVDMAWTIQGNTEQELPEVVMAGVRINHLDMLSAKPFDPRAPSGDR